MGGQYTFLRALPFVVLLLGGLLTLASAKKDKAPPIDPTAYDALVSNRVTSVAHLLNWFAEQQDHFERLIPPGLEVLNQPGTPDVLVIDLDSKDLPPEFAKHLLGTTPVFRYSVPTYDVFVQETAEGTIEVRDGTGNTLYTDPAPASYAIPYEALFRQSQYPHHYIPELARYRLNARVTLLPLAYVEHYLFAKQQIEEAAKLFEEEEPPLMMMMSGSGDDVWISAMTRMTNGLQLSLDYTESYSGQVWSAYSYDARYCPITNSVGGSGGGSPPVPGTNDPPACTNCPISDCEIDFTNSFLGLERVWSLAYSNLLLTGATRTVWLDTRPMGLDAQTNPTHRFYGFGSNVDTDSDGLNDGHELFISHTDRENADTDSDGLPDGWEVQNGLDPNNAADASSDADGDTLTAQQEHQLNLNPNSANAVQDIGPSQARIEFRSATVYRDKIGFEAFAPDAQGLVRHYLRFEATGSAYENPGGQWERTVNWEVERLADAFTGATPLPGSSGSFHSSMVPSTNLGWEYEYELTTACTVTGIWEVTAVYEESGIPGTDSCTYTGSLSMIYNMDIGDAPYLLCVYFPYSWDYVATMSFWSEPVVLTPTTRLEGPYFVEDIEIESQLSDEYTTAMLTNFTWINFGAAPALTNVAWGTGWVYQVSYDAPPFYSYEPRVVHTFFTNAALTAAVHRLTTNELHNQLTRIGYRLHVPTQSGVVSRVRVLELFQPQESNILTVVTSRVVLVNGTGGTQIVERADFAIEPPMECGKRFPIILRVEFTNRIGKINYGFEPRYTLLEGGYWPWTSVAKDGTNVICKLTVEPAVVAEQIEVVVTSGSSCASVTPTNFTAYSNDLVILGEGNAGDAIAEARIRGTTTAYAKLNIRSQPRVELTAGVYFIYDTNSPSTYPVGGPAASDVVETLNDVFEQAQIAFTLAESVATNIAYDSSGLATDTNGMFEFAEESILTNLTWQGDVVIFFAKKSGETYGGGSTNFIRGWALGDLDGGIVFVDDCLSTAIPLIAAHEVGHNLNLSTWWSTSPPMFTGHDHGPWPTGETALMRSGTNDVGGIVDSPGRWIRHEDWKEANNKAGGL